LLISGSFARLSRKAWLFFPPPLSLPPSGLYPSRESNHWCYQPG